MNLNDIEPTALIDPTGAHDGRLGQLMPVLDQAAMASDQEAPTTKAQRKEAAKKIDAPSLRDIYAEARAEEEGKGQGGREGFSWKDLDGKQKKDLLIRLGLSLMTHGPSSRGLEGVGKAGLETLGHFDSMREADRKDRQTQQERAKKEGLTLAELANMEHKNKTSGRQVVPGADGFYLADAAEGSMAPMLTGEGNPVQPAATGRESVFQQKVDQLKQIYTARGMSEQEANDRAVNEALRNRSHFNPTDRLRARSQVMEILIPDGRPSREMRDLMKTTGKSAQQIIDEETDRLIQSLSQQQPAGLSDVAPQDDNPFLR